MKQILRILVVVMAWTTLASPAAAAWTSAGFAGIQTTAGGDNPQGVAVHAALRLAVVANKNAKSVSLINLDTGATAATLAVAARPRDVVVDAAKSIAYLLHQSGTVSVIDLAAKKFVTQWKLGINTVSPVLGPGGTELLLADPDGQQLLRVATATGTVTATLALTYTPQSLALTGDGTTLLVGSDESGLHLISTASWAETGAVALGGSVQALGWWSAAGKAIVITDDQLLSIVDIQARTVAGTVALDADVQSLVVANNIAYLTAPDPETVGAVDLGARKFLGRYALGAEPFGLDYDPTAAQLLVTAPDDAELLSVAPAKALLAPVAILPEQLKKIAVSNTSDQAVLATNRKDSSLLNLVDKSQQSFALPARAVALGIDPGRNLALLGLGLKQEIHFLDMANKVLLPDAVALAPKAVAIGVDSGLGIAVVATRKSGKLVLINTATRTLSTTLSIAGTFRGLAVNGTTHRAYLINTAGKTGEIDILDLTTQAVTGSIAFANDPQAIVIDEALNLAVVAFRPQNQLQVIDLATNTVVQTFTTSSHPVALALNPKTHMVTVAVKSAGEVDLLDLSTKTFTTNFYPLPKPIALAVTTRFNQAPTLAVDNANVVFVPLPNPLPVLSQLQPAQTLPVTTLTLTAVGDQFIDGASRVVLNSTFLSTTWIDAQHLTAAVPPALLAAPGAYPVKVVTAPGGSGGGLSGGGGDSQTLTFSVLFPAPVLTSLAPTSLMANGADQTLTLTGSQFYAASQVYAGAQALTTTLINNTQLKAVVPGTLLTQSGQVPVTVINPTPGGGTSAPITVPVIGALPTITGFTPTQGPVGTTVAITGTNFDGLNPGSNIVKFNGAAAVVVSATATQLNVIVPTTASTGPISVTTKGGTATSTSAFTVQANQAFDISLAPAAIQVPVNGYGGTRVKLSSTGLVSYTQLAALTITGLPPGLTYSLSRPNVYLNQDTILNFQSSGVAPGSYTVTLTASGPSDVSTLTRTRQLTLQVLDATATTVTGKVLHAEDDAPFVGALVHLGTQQALTDDTGTYRFLSPTVVGDQVVLIDANVANTATVVYPGKIVMPVMIAANRDNPVLTSYVRGIDPTQYTPVTPGAETQVTSPSIPNYALRIPAGAVLYSNTDGQPITQINVKVVPVDKLPVKPLPDGVTTKNVYLYYFFKEGGANPTRPIPVTMNNDIDALPGDKVDLWYYDESITPDPNSNTWRVMGTGTVTQDGKSIVSDPGVGIPKFCCGASFPAPRQQAGAGNNGPDGGDGDGPQCGNPVDVATGNGSVLVPQRFGIKSLLPVNLDCRYRSTNPLVGFFGRGTSFSYDWFATQAGTQAVQVTTPQGVKYMLSLDPDGVYRESNGRAGGYGMEVAPTTTGRTLKLKGGMLLDFDGPGRLAAVRDQNGNKLSFQLDTNGYVQTVTDPVGRVYTITTTRMAIGRTIYTLATQITDSLGRTMKFGYDSSLRLISVTDAANQTTSYVYDSTGHITQKTDPRGAITQYTYDAAGRTTGETLPDGTQNRFVYTVVGNTVTETRYTDPNGNTKTYRMNGQGYVVQTIDALGRIFKKDIDYATNQVTAEYDPLGRATKYTYDAHGNRTSIVDFQGNTTLIEYDQTWNKPAKIVNALGGTIILTYDSVGNLASFTNPNRETVKYTYDKLGKLASATDPLNRTIQFTYNSEGNLISTTDPLGRTKKRAYDVANRLVSSVDGRGRTTQFIYDPLNRPTQVLDPLGNSTSFAYDANNNRTTITDPRGITVETNAYDSRNRLISRVDAMGQVSTYTWDGTGNLTQKTDRKGQVTRYTHDVLNRISRIEYADGRTVNYEYDLAGNRVRESDSVAGETLYTYDNLNRLTSETTDRGIVAYQYDALSRLTQRTINGGDPTTYSYDADSRLTGITYRNQTTTYQYDAAGRLTSRNLPNGITQAFAYDNANQLLSITYKKTDSTVLDTVSYTYDEAGNPISRNRSQLGSVPETAFTATYDNNNRMLTYNGSPLTYDANGNLISRQTPQGTITYVWDAKNRLTQISGPNGNASFKYDARGRRIEKTINGQTIAFLYDGPQAIAELQGSSIGATYLTGLQIDEVLARYTNQGNRTLLTDALGSILATTDDSQTAQTIYGYSPYGEQTQVGAADSSLQYTGRENDNTGLYYYRARYYDPQLKRFVSSDPKGLRAGINTYTYVLGKPIRRVDPFGTDSCEVAIWRGGYIVGWVPCGSPNDPSDSPSGGSDQGGSNDSCPESGGPKDPDSPGAPDSEDPGQGGEAGGGSEAPQKEHHDVKRCMQLAAAKLATHVDIEYIADKATEGRVIGGLLEDAAPILAGVALGDYAAEITECLTGKYPYEYIWSW